MCYILFRSHGFTDYVRMSGRKYQVLEETTTIHTLYTHAYETTEMYTQYIRMYDRNDNDVHVNLQTWVLRDNI